MRHLVLTENITADGRIEMLDTWFDPSPGTGFDDLQAEMERLEADADAVLLGRQTFEDFRSYWPQRTDEPAGAYLAQVHKYVVSASLTDPEWQHSTILSGDPVDEIRRLKDAPGGDIVLTGSITLAHAVLAAGLVDEIRLFVHPAIQGRGRGLVPEGTALPSLTLIETMGFRSGAVLLRYEVGAPGATS